MDRLTLQEAINHLYQTAILGRARTSTQRLKVLADYCVCQLDIRGLANAETDVVIPGGGREKQ